VVHLDGHVDGEVLLDDDGNATLEHDIDLDGHIDGSLGDLLDGHFLPRVDVGDHGHVIGLAHSDYEGLFIGDCLDEFLGLFDGHVGPREHGNLAGDRLNVVLRHFAFLAGDDDLGFSG